MISNCSRDERGLYSGGQAGDQDGGEYRICAWYLYPWGGWNVVLHHPNANVRALITKLAYEAANNNNIGYDQSQRYTFWQQLAANGYRPANIKTPCESDCSASTAAIVKAVGYLTGNEALKGVSIYAYTGNLRQVLVEAGFQALTASKYLTSDEYLYAGDIILNVQNHVVINVTDGAKAKKEAATGYKFKTAQIKLGDTGLDVFRLRVILKARGFFSGVVTGTAGKKYTSAVKKAVKLFQTKAGLKVTGVCDRDTWATLLGLDQVDGYWLVEECKYGDTNNKSVLLMQEFLKGLPKKYYTGKLDWSFGAESKKALIKFQKAANKAGANLRTDGVFDTATSTYMIG